MTKTTAEKIAVMQHYADGGEVEVWSGSWYEWVKEPAPIWNWSHFKYRIALRQSEVDWSQVGKPVNAFITDEHGWSWGFEVPPTLKNGRWSMTRNAYLSDLFPSFRPGNMPWQESLIVRPGHDPR